MTVVERRQTAKIYQFPQRRTGETVRQHAEKVTGTPQPSRSPVIHWDGWYHDAAIMEQHDGKA